MMTPLFIRRLRDLSDLDLFVVDLWNLRAQKTIWLMQGEVGAGKTETVKALARSLNIEEVASPSFAIHHRYPVSKNFSIDHLDLYRLESEDDLESTGFWDLMSEPEGLIIIEWADKLDPSFLPKDWTLFQLKYQILSEKERQIEVSRQAAF